MKVVAIVMAILVIVICTPWEIIKRLRSATIDYYYWVRIEWDSAINYRKDEE